MVNTTLLPVNGHHCVFSTQTASCPQTASATRPPSPPPPSRLRTQSNTGALIGGALPEPAGGVLAALQPLYPNLCPCGMAIFFGKPAWQFSFLG